MVFKEYVEDNVGCYLDVECKCIFIMMVCEVVVIYVNLGEVMVVVEWICCFGFLFRIVIKMVLFKCVLNLNGVVDN